MSTAAWYKRAVYQFVQSRGCEVGTAAIDPWRLPADAAA
jgi:hypothetical protein